MIVDKKNIDFTTDYSLYNSIMDFFSANNVQSIRFRFDRFKSSYKLMIKICEYSVYEQYSTILSDLSTEQAATIMNAFNDFIGE